MVHCTATLYLSRILTSPLSGPSSGSRAGPTPLRPYQAPVAGRSPSNSPQRRRRCSFFSPPRRLSNPWSNPRNHPGDCCDRAGSRDPGAMRIPYSGPYYPGRDDPLHLTVACGHPREAGEASHLLSNPVYGRTAAHYPAGTTCHIALAVILRLPLPHTQATRISLPMSRYRRLARQRDGAKHAHSSHTGSSSITPDSHRLLTRSPVMPQAKNPRVTVQSRPPQQ